MWFTLARNIGKIHSVASQRVPMWDILTLEHINTQLWKIKRILQMTDRNTLLSRNLQQMLQDVTTTSYTVSEAVVELLSNTDKLSM